MKRTLILGATTNIERYAYKAAKRLTQHKHPIVPVGIKKGEVFGEVILNTKDLQKEIDTITLYVGVRHQPEWYGYIVETNPRRVIFNPGTENPELQTLLKENEIPYEEACTLVLLSLNAY